LVHGDLCGPITPPSLAGNRYIFVLIDDSSRYMWTYLLKEKSKAFETFINFKALIEKETGDVIKVLRTDRGGEFTSTEFNRFCETLGPRPTCIERRLYKTERRRAGEED